MKFAKTKKTYDRDVLAVVKKLVKTVKPSCNLGREKRLYHWCHRSLK